MRVALRPLVFMSVVSAVALAAGDAAGKVEYFRAVQVDAERSTGQRAR